MIKYNYTGAAALWDDLMYFFEPWTFDDIQKDRRYFMREITRGNYSEPVEYLENEIEYILPAPNAKSRCYDFELIGRYKAMIEKLKAFKGVL